jgi:ATP synthase F1 epsilon subunit
MPAFDTPFGEIINADVSEVLVPGEAGEMGFLPGHTPLVTLLGIGELRYVVDGTTKYAAVARGYVEVSGDTIRVVTESCELADKIDAARAAEAEKRADLGPRGPTPAGGRPWPRCPSRSRSTPSARPTRAPSSGPRPGKRSRSGS